MAALISPVPFGKALGIVSGSIVRVTEDWRRWLQQVKDAIDAAGRKVGAAVALSAQASSLIGAVDTPALTAGLYRVSWHLRVTRAATTAGSVALALSTTAGGQVTTETVGTLATNVLGDARSGVAVLDVDAGAAVSYATVYSSTGATALQYALQLSVEALPA